MVIVGGHDRMHREYIDICNNNGFKAKVYTHMPSEFSKRLGSADGILLLTNTVAHKMVLTALKEAKKRNIPVVKNHNSSIAAVSESVMELGNLATC
jgi:hypothetical protein